MLAPYVSTDHPIVGVEPSAILTFRDEYIDLADDENLVTARQLASNTFLVDEFIAVEIENGNIRAEDFTSAQKKDKVARALPAKSIVFGCGFG